MHIHKIVYINPSNAELNPICHLLALLGAHHIFHVSGLRDKLRTITKKKHTQNTKERVLIPYEN